MKNLKRWILAALVVPVIVPATAGDRLVILHTNDTHSQIDPVDDAAGLGGILRRKALIDSVRSVEDNVLLVDAGDAVQGTLFFNLFGGELENKLMDRLGYDYRILGNHEFDNGVSALAAKISGTDSKWLSTNYKMHDNGLEEIFEPYAVTEVEDRKIGIIGINLRPKGMISEGNYDGVEYLDAYKAANAMAWYLKNVKDCDLVIALTHIGYEPVGETVNDSDLARQSENIDIIIGGHSHTTIDPSYPSEDKPWRITNAVGKPVLVVQTGKSGRNLGRIAVDLGTLDSEYSLIPVNKRLDDRLDEDLVRLITPYRAGVDSLMNRRVARSAVEMPNDGPALLNLMSDYVKLRGQQLAGNVDLGMMNRGGLRRSLPKGDITEGMIMQMLPFGNRVEVIELKGSDLLENFEIMTHTSGNGVSEGVDIVYDPATHKVVSATIDGKPVDPDKTYRLATIDYLANGGDYMTPLTRGTKISTTAETLCDDFLAWLKANYSKKKLNPSTKVRMRPVVSDLPAIISQN